MAYGRYFSLILLALGFITTLTAAAPTNNDCDIPKEQATTLREWVIETAGAVTHVMDTDSILEEVKGKIAPLLEKNAGSTDSDRVTNLLDNVRMILDGQKAALMGRGSVAKDTGILEGWPEAVESKEENVQDSYKESVLGAALKGAGLKKESAPEVAALIWKDRPRGGSTKSSDSDCTD